MAAPTLDIVMEYLRDQVFTGSDGVNLRTWLGGNYINTPVAPAGWTNSHKAIIVHEEVGAPHETGATDSGTIVAKCYGGSASYEAARDVANALRAYLHNARGKETASGSLMSAHEINRFQGPPEEDTGWPVMITKYSVVTE